MPALAGKLRIAARVAWLAAALLLCLPPHMMLRTLGHRSLWAQRYLGIAARAIGARVTVRGTALTHDVFHVANHLSWTDICILGGVTWTAFVAQDKIEDWPLIGWLSTINDTLFVSRTDTLSVQEQIARVRAAIARPQPMTIFPEGTTTDGGSLLPFKPSLFAGLMPLPGEAARPLRVQPVLLEFDAAGRELAWIGEETAAENARRVFTRRGSFAVTVHFLEAFDPVPCGDRKAVAAEARRRIAAALSAVLGETVT